jgi:hypothetical protein
MGESLRCSVPKDRRECLQDIVRRTKITSVSVNFFNILFFAG